MAEEMLAVVSGLAHRFRARLAVAALAFAAVTLATYLIAHLENFHRICAL